jgi:hypothetical protein
MRRTGPAIPPQDGHRGHEEKRVRHPHAERPRNHFGCAADVRIYWGGWIPTTDLLITVGVDRHHSGNLPGYGHLTSIGARLGLVKNARSCPEKLQRNCSGNHWHERVSVPDVAAFRDAARSQLRGEVDPRTSRRRLTRWRGPRGSGGWLRRRGRLTSASRRSWRPTSSPAAPRAAACACSSPSRPAPA